MDRSAPRSERVGARFPRRRRIGSSLAPIRILPSATGIVAGSTPPSTKFFATGEGTYKFAGPCPGKGKKHTYSFTLYALPEPLADLSTFTSSQQLIRALENTAIAAVSVKGTYAQSA
jgi:phosphatidylethanolamine-binding protein (PEBP) family uncharacterized protein